MPEVRLSLTVLKESFGVCHFHPDALSPVWAEQSSFLTITRTAEELSVVCDQSLIPEGTDCECDWMCLKVAGPLGFTQVGILSSLLVPLAKANISIFAISTYNTDYLLVKGKDLEAAVSVLASEGHWISRLQ